MKSIFKLSPIAIAIAAMCGVSIAMAEEHVTTNGPEPGFHKSYNEIVIVDLTNTAVVNLEKEMIASYLIDLDAIIDVDSEFDVESASAAIVDDKQISHDNDVTNGNPQNREAHQENKAKLKDSVLKNAKGNIGVNITAGDNNIQDNSVAIAVVNKHFAEPGSVDAEIFVFQDATNNQGLDAGTVNKAKLQDWALKNAKGNINVNISAGHSNLQKNNVAMSVGPAVLAMASAYTLQQNGGNQSINRGVTDTAKLSGEALRDASGNILTNIAAGANNLQNNNLALTVKKFCTSCTH